MKKLVGSNGPVEPQVGFIDGYTSEQLWDEVKAFLEKQGWKEV